MSNDVLVALLTIVSLIIGAVLTLLYNSFIDFKNRIKKTYSLKKEIKSLKINLKVIEKANLKIEGSNPSKSVCCF